MADDPEHEEARDAPSDLDVMLRVLHRPWSHRHADPRANEWTWGDIAVGWTIAHVVLATMGFANGALRAYADPVASGVYAMIGSLLWGTLVISLLGVPWGAALATALHRVRSELLHLAAFAALATAGCLIHSAMVFPAYRDESLVSIEFLHWFAWMSIHGVAAAVVARFVAKRWAILVRGRRSPAVVDGEGEHA